MALHYMAFGYYKVQPRSIIMTVILYYVETNWFTIKNLLTRKLVFKDLVLHPLRYWNSIGSHCNIVFYQNQFKKMHAQV
jgi:hypothetical protein